MTPSLQGRRFGVQIFGREPEKLAQAAQMAFKTGASLVDINMGCPVRKVCRTGGGSAMMTELDKTAHLVRGMVNALRIPVTAKMRLGWDDTIVEVPITF